MNIAEKRELVRQLLELLINEDMTPAESLEITAEVLCSLVMTFKIDPRNMVQNVVTIWNSLLSLEHAADIMRKLGVSAPKERA